MANSSGEEMMKLLRELLLDGHSIIIVTHDPNIAEFTDRVIEIKDGEIISDQPNSSISEYRRPIAERKDTEDKSSRAKWRLNWSRYLEAFNMAPVAMPNNRLHTFLTMLGIIIDIASVVSVVALGAGSQQSIMDEIASMGTNTIEIKPGTGRGDLRSALVRSLTTDDANTLKTLPFIDSVTPTV